jgi:hypothetical protein
MLQTPHFQVVFTLPAALRPIATANPRLVYGLLFAAGTSVLKELGEQRFGARMGITAVLHTWTSDLNYHPHIHCLVTGGGLHIDDDRWVASRANYLFPGRILGAMFRGRFLDGLIAALDAGDLQLPRIDPVAGAKAFRSTLRALSKRHAKWVVHVEPPKGRPVEHVVRYLARYIKRIAISDPRIVAVTDTHVVFSARHGVVRLDGVEFVRRFAMHVLPSGFRKIRHYGLYAPGNAGHRLELARELLVTSAATPQVLDTDEPEVSSAEPDADPSDARELCPACGERQVQRHFMGARAAARARGPP